MNINDIDKRINSTKHQNASYRAATLVRIFAKGPNSAYFDKRVPKTGRLLLKSPKFQ